ncbi:60S ribosomal protein eL6 [Calcarisporiella thermophila]|uniref:60S ribosomal protein eL6 n=1 Tax=Calcarisporiella thermophila TaxID=911321 RepID=UPI003743A377
MAQNTRNSALAPGIMRLSRSALYAKKGLYKRQKKDALAAAPTAEAVKKVTVGGDKNGSSRLVPVRKAPRFYPAEDIPQPKISRKSVKPTKLRSNITPGTVLILLAGRFRGKRVVFLKQLESGLLLVTGPFKLNGVPLRRVNQAYVIATSTKIDISSIQIDGKFNDTYFKKSKDSKKKATEEEFFDSEKKKEPLAESRIADQKSVDKELISAISKIPHLRSYLQASFSLTKGQAPHRMLF